jgi:WXG100 family type VII secretion target
MTAGRDTINDNDNDADSVQETLLNANEAIQAVLNDLQEVINPLRATWSGASEAEYLQVQARWNSDMRKMYAALAGCSTTPDAMGKNYVLTGNRLALVWSAIR